MFLEYTFLTFALLFALALFSYSHFRDVFHPVILLSGLLAFLYVGMPLQLHWDDPSRLRWYLADAELEYVQLINLVGVSSLVFGALIGGGSRRISLGNGRVSPLDPFYDKALVAAAKVLGVAGLLAFVSGLVNVGGFASAYGKAYGGGGHASGYLREAYMFGLPAAIMILYARRRTKLSGGDLFWLVLSAAPLVIHGFLGARRGPTFMVITALAIGWYLFRCKRPSLTLLGFGGIFLASLLLLLVANRGAIYLGSDQQLAQTPEKLFSILEHNEFTYGGAAILNADARNQYWWGRRYIAILFIRPIPRQIWPDKYKDAERLLDIPNLEEGNLGTGGADFRGVVGWTGAAGAATGLVADMWIEFWVGMSVALFVIGWLFGRTWRLAVSSGGLPMMLYTLLVSLSAYLVMQSLEAFAFRALLLSAGLWAGWRYATKRRLKHRRRALAPDT